MEKQVMWAVFEPSGRPHVHTLDYQRKGAISRFLGKGKMTWEECKPFGWKVKKVEITIKPI